MKGWTHHVGIGISLPVDNIDTDQLIPARFMSQPRAAGYGQFLLHDLRFNSAGKPDETFILNRVPEASVLVSGRNFGNGSSREAAVYALVDAGIQVVIATGFGDIFAANAVNNGLLPAQVELDDVFRLRDVIANETASFSVHLDTCTLSCQQITVPFKLDNSWQIKLINGWDDIDLSVRHATAIDSFRANRYHKHEWALPGARDKPCGGEQKGHQHPAAAQNRCSSH